jgi:hypothetical protein
MVITNMDTSLTKRIKQIGKSGICSDEDFDIFLPDKGTLRGSESIFTISWANATRYIDADIEYFVKGLHLIEEKYKIFSKHDFGFGSPSPSYKVISKLKLKDAILAKRLTSWISENGGNYYIANEFA